MDPPGYLENTFSLFLVPAFRLKEPSLERVGLDFCRLEIDHHHATPRPLLLNLLFDHLEDR